MDLIEHRNNATAVRHPWEEARVEVLIDLIKNTKEFNNSPTIADIGCGDVFVINSLSKTYPDSFFFAVDVNFTADEIEVFSNSMDPNKIIITTKINDISASNKSIDILLLMDVIEHIENEEDFLIQLRDKPFITPQTLFVITVPAFQFLFSDHDKFLKHYRRYSKKTLKKTLNSSGFEIQEQGYFFMSLFLIRIIQKLFRMNNKGEIINTSFSKIYTTILKRVLILDYKILKIFKKAGIKLPGLSTYAICLKSV